MAKSQKDRSYEDGVHDGQRGNLLKDASMEMVPSELTGTYGKGYDYGARHREQYKESERRREEHESKIREHHESRESGSQSSKDIRHHSHRKLDELSNHVREEAECNELLYGSSSEEDDDPEYDDDDRASVRAAPPTQEELRAARESLVDRVIHEGSYNEEAGKYTLEEHYLNGSSITIDGSLESIKHLRAAKGTLLTIRYEYHEKPNSNTLRTDRMTYDLSKLSESELCFLFCRSQSSIPKSAVLNEREESLSDENDEQEFSLLDFLGSVVEVAAMLEKYGRDKKLTFQKETLCGEDGCRTVYSINGKEVDEEDLPRCLRNQE